MKIPEFKDLVFAAYLATPGQDSSWTAVKAIVKDCFDELSEGDRVELELDLRASGNKPWSPNLHPDMTVDQCIREICVNALELLCSRHSKIQRTDYITEGRLLRAIIWPFGDMPQAMVTTKDDPNHHETSVYTIPLTSDTLEGQLAEVRAWIDGKDARDVEPLTGGLNGFSFTLVRTPIKADLLS